MLDDTLFNFFDLGGRGRGRGTFPLDLTSGSGFATISSTEGVCFPYVATCRLVEVHIRFYLED